MYRLLSLLLVAAALAACGGDPAPQPADSALLQFCLDETNRYRAMDGHGPMQRSSALEDYAATGAALDTQQQRAHGHFGDTGGGGVANLENACPSWLGWSLGDGPDAEKQAVGDCLKAFYDEGMGGPHYQNLMSNDRYVGCGIYVQNGGITIIQDFGP